jgi:hypothetical protein
MIELRKWLVGRNAGAVLAIRLSYARGEDVMTEGWRRAGRLSKPG